MTKRFIAFIVDAFILSTFVRASYPMLSNESAFQTATIQFIAVVVIVLIQHVFWGRTLGLAIFGLRINWATKESLRGHCFAVFPFICYFGIPYLWAIEAYLNDITPNDVWLRLPREGIDHYYPLVTFGQNSIAAVWLIMAVVPLWLGKKRTGWELFGEFKIENTSESCN